MSINFSKPQAPFGTPKILVDNPTKASVQDFQDAFAKAITRRLGYVVTKDCVFYVSSKPEFCASLVEKWKTMCGTVSIWSIRGCAPWIRPHVTHWLPFSVNSQKMGLSSQREMEATFRHIKRNDLIFLSNPLYLWGSVAKEEEIEALGHLVYEKQAFLVVDESYWDTCRFASTPSPYGSMASCCPDRALIMESLQCKTYCDTDMVAVVKGRHPIWDRLGLASVDGKRGGGACGWGEDMDEKRLGLTTRAFSLTFASIGRERLHRISTILHALRLYAHRRLKPLTKTIGLGEGGTCVMVPFPKSRLEAAAKLGLVLVKPSDYAINGYLPLFLTDFDGQTALKEAPTPFIYRQADLEEWVGDWAPRIKEGLDRLQMLLKLSPK
jgi:hypothetical protein